MSALNARRRAIVAVLVLLPLAIALIPYLLAPRNGFQLEMVVGATEFGPFVAVASIVLLALALLIARPSRTARRLAPVATAATVLLALYPVWTAERAARRGLADVAELGTPAGARLAEATAPIRIATLASGLPVADGVTERALTYPGADGTALTMRVFRGAGCSAARRCPVVAVLYAGAWRNGDATQASPVNRHLAGRGYVVVALDYRHTPRFRYPAQPVDVRRGLAMLRDSAAAWGADLDRVALWGRSSGAHLAMLAAWDTRDAPPPVRVRSLIGFYGPYDLVEGYTDLPHPDPLDIRQILRAFIGGPPAAYGAAFRAASPSSYVRPGLPPTLLVYARRDHLVKASFGRHAAADLRAAGVPTVYVELPWAEHGFDFVPAGPNGQAGLAVATAFLAATLCAERSGQPRPPSCLDVASSR